MNTPANHRQTAPHRLRELLARPGAVRSLGTHDVLAALLMEEAGFELTFVGGFSTSATLHGLPDLDFLGLAEMRDAVGRVARRVHMPVIADADTGYGDVHNVAHTTREFESVGAAGLILEDQVAPKRCGHFKDKQVVSGDDFLLRIRAAVHGRSDPDFVIVARTDARATHGIDEAIDRVNRACEVGADVAFVEAPQSVAEIETISQRVAAPKLINMLAFGKTPILSATQLEKLGYKIVVAPIASLLVEAKAVQELCKTYLRDGHTEAVAEGMLTFDEIKETLGLGKHLELRSALEEPPAAAD